MFQIILFLLFLFTIQPAHSSLYFTNCTHSTDCSFSHSHCSTLLGKCICQFGYVFNEDYIKINSSTNSTPSGCIPASCENSVECAGKYLYRNTLCIGNLCSCELPFEVNAITQTCERIHVPTDIAKVPFFLWFISLVCLVGVIYLFCRLPCCIEQCRRRWIRRRERRLQNSRGENAAAAAAAGITIIEMIRF